MTDAMTLREMCNAFGATPRTLHFCGQTEPPFPSRYDRRRLFTRRDRARLKLTLRGKRSGMPLPDISGQDRLSQGQRSRICDLARDRRMVMERQRAEPEDAIATLKDQHAGAQGVLGTFRRNAAA